MIAKAGAWVGQKGKKTVDSVSQTLRLWAAVVSHHPSPHRIPVSQVLQYNMPSFHFVLSDIFANDVTEMFQTQQEA